MFLRHRSLKYKQDVASDHKDGRDRETVLDKVLGSVWALNESGSSRSARCQVRMVWGKTITDFAGSEMLEMEGSVKAYGDRLNGSLDGPPYVDETAIKECGYEIRGGIEMIWE